MLTNERTECDTFLDWQIRGIILHKPAASICTAEELIYPEDGGSRLPRTVRIRMPE
jgi:hypothetical protein